MKKWGICFQFFNDGYKPFSSVNFGSNIVRHKSPNKGDPKRYSFVAIIISILGAKIRKYSKIESRVSFCPFITKNKNWLTITICVIYGNKNYYL